MNKADYEGCLTNMRLASGALFPIPVTLDVSKEQVETLGLKEGARVALRDPRDDTIIAILTVSDLYDVNVSREAELVMGADDKAHPAVAFLYQNAKDYYVGGNVQAVAKPQYFDYVELRYTPAELRHHFSKVAWRKVVAFQTRNPMHLSLIHI